MPRLPLLALATLLAACQPPAGGSPELAVAWRVSPSPPGVGPATVELGIADAAGRPVQGAEVRVEATMTHPGMKPVLAAARETAPGRYEAALELTMRGDWVLLVDAALPGGGRLHRRLDLPGVGAAGGPP